MCHYTNFSYVLTFVFSACLPANFRPFISCFIFRTATSFRSVYLVLTVLEVDTKGFNGYENLFKNENNCKPSIVKPFHFESNLKPPVTQSVALESYSDEVKLDLSEATFTKPEDNLTIVERKVLKDLKNNTKINLKKADKGTTTVVMNKEDKIKEGQSQLDNTDHYQPLDHPMVAETASKVTSLIEDLYDGQFIDETTMECLLQTPKPPRVPEFYTLTKIHKPKPFGRPIISGCDGPTERISAFVDKLIHPIAKIQKLYIKDTTDFINVIERKKLPQNPLLVTMTS